MGASVRWRRRTRRGGGRTPPWCDRSASPAVGAPRAGCVP